MTVLEMYRVQNKTGVQVLETARAFRQHMRFHGCSQHEFGAEISVTGGVIHHYTSVLNLPEPLRVALAEDRLTFKEARSIADLPPAKQEQYAAPFLDRRLTSVHVERYVSMARADPQLIPDELVEIILNPEPMIVVNGSAVGNVLFAAPLASLNYQTEHDKAAALKKTLMDAAGALRADSVRQMPEYLRMDMVYAIRVLDAAVREALRKLS